MRYTIACFTVLALSLLQSQDSSAAASAEPASSAFSYKGYAYKDDKLVYIEKHSIKKSADGKIESATTEYTNPAGKVIVKLTSDFRTSLTAPAYTSQDFRDDSQEGIRRDGGNLILFDKEKGESEGLRALTQEESNEMLLVGCQGLNYYVLDRLDSFKENEEVPLRFLIPGKLDYYDFVMKRVSSTPQSQAGIIEFELTVKNWFLKIFAPKLHVKYDSTLKRIVGYQGISNIMDDEGSNQVVTIKYEYPTEARSL